jgi:hypothetical protein
MSTILSLRSQSLRTFLRLEPNTILEELSAKKIKPLDFIAIFFTTFFELANSHAYSLTDRVQAIQFFTSIKSSIASDDPSIDDHTREFLKKIQLCFIDKMPLESRKLFLQGFIKQLGFDDLCRCACEIGLEQTLSTLHDLNGKFNNEQLKRLLVAVLTHKQASCLPLMITLGAKVNEKISEQTLLNCAIEAGDLKSVQFLVNNNADILMCSKNMLIDFSFSALARALHLADTDICNYLLQQRSLSQKERAKVYLELARLIKHDRVQINFLPHIHMVLYSFNQLIEEINKFSKPDIPLLPKIIIHTLDDCTQLDLDLKNCTEKLKETIEKVPHFNTNEQRSKFQEYYQLSEELKKNINFANKNRFYLKEAFKFFCDHPEHLSECTEQDLLDLSESYTFYQIGKEECADLRVIGKDFSQDNGLPSSFFIINSPVFRVSMKDSSGGTLQTNLSINSFNALKELIHSFKINTLSVEEAVELLEFLRSLDVNHQLKKDTHQLILKSIREAKIEKGEQLEALYIVANRDSAFNLQLFCLLKLMHLNGCYVELYDAQNERQIMDDPYKIIADLHYNPLIARLSARTTSPQGHQKSHNWEVSISFENYKIDAIRIDAIPIVGIDGVYHRTVGLNTLLACNDSQRCILSFLLKHTDPVRINIVFNDNPSSSQYSPADALELLQTMAFIPLRETAFDPEVKRLFALYIIKKLVQEEKVMNTEHIKSLTSFAFDVLSEKEVKDTIKREQQETNKLRENYKKKMAKEQNEWAIRVRDAAKRAIKLRQAAGTRSEA